MPTARREDAHVLGGHVVGEARCDTGVHGTYLGFPCGAGNGPTWPSEAHPTKGTATSGAGAA
jgi:hypothetical protein